MKNEIKIPSMGESITEATVGVILKASGSQVAMDDEIIELETDKVNQVLYAPQAGILTLTVKPDDVVKIGQVIGFVEVGSVEVASQTVDKEPANDKITAPSISQIEKQLPESNKPLENSEIVKTDAEQPVKEKTSAAAVPQQPVRMTKEVWIEEIKATVDSSAATSQHIEPSQPLSKPSSPQSDERLETRGKMSKIRRLIATRLVEVQKTTAMLTTFNEVDMTAIMELREKYKEPFAKEYEVKLGFMSFFVKACTAALQQFPEINSYIDGEEIVTRQYIDIGIAVGTEKGLIVPVVRSCEKLSFAQVEQAIDSYAKKARQGGLTVADLQGGGFTITNGGVYGSLLSTPILNPPQCAILGMHKIMKRAVVINDEIVIRQMMYLALSYDHRLIDGKEAVSFLVHVKNCLEDPSRLLLGV